MVANTKFLITINIILCLSSVKAQYEPTGVTAISVSPTSVLISCQGYDPFDSLDEFSVRYTLESKEQCNSDDETLFDEQVTDWAKWNRTSLGSNVFEYRMELTELFPYSSYTYYVSSRFSTPPSITYKSAEARFTTQASVPYSVQNVQTMQTTTTLVISWEASDVACVITTYYLVKITLITQDQCIETSITIRDLENITETSLSQMDLIPYTTYRVEITPVNSVGNGPMIYEDITTSETAPTSLPSNLRLEAQGTCTLQFTWNPLPCGNRGGQITYVYEIDNLILQVTDVGTADTNIVMLSNLDCLGSYQMRVKATNSAGDSQWSDYQAVSTVLLDISITIFFGYTELLIKWDDSNGDCSCSVMYLIEYTLTNPGQCGNQDGGGRMNAGTTSSTSYTLTGLLPYSTYDVYVTPMVDGRQGVEASSPGTTAENKPTSGPVVSVNERTKSSIYFTWHEIPCELRGGIITSYNVQLTDANDTIIFQMILDATQLSVNITGLQPDQEYTFTISATNGLRQGPVTEHTAKTLSLVPSMPVQVRAYAAENSITITWNTPVYPNGIILDYQIKYQALEKLFDVDFMPGAKYTALQRPHSATDDTHALVIDDLEPSTKYEFILSGRTSVGQGAKAIINVYTSTFTFDESYMPDQPIVDSSGLPVTVDLSIVHKYASNVYVAVEKVDTTARKRREPEDTLYANLTRYDIDDNEFFTIGDNETYGGYQNHPMIPRNDYLVMIQYASCIPVEECSTSTWSNPTTFTVDGVAPGSTSSVIAIAITIILVVIIILGIVVVLIVLKRRQKSPPQKSPTSDETYDEINPKMSQQSVKQSETGYEVNLAMEGIQTSSQSVEEGLDYEDVNIKRESDYQGLNTEDRETELDYQGLGETDQKKQSDYQELNKADMAKEQDYQDLGQKRETNRKTSTPYVNVPI